MLDSIDETIELILQQDTEFSCPVSMHNSFVDLLPTVAMGVDHLIELDTGESGTMVNIDGEIYVCLGQQTVSIAGSCITIMLMLPDTCPTLPELVTTTTTHVYEYNQKRVNPCE
jgi:hypothetical protein